MIPPRTFARSELINTTTVRVHDDTGGCVRTEIAKIRHSVVVAIVWKNRTLKDLIYPRVRPDFAKAHRPARSSDRSCGVSQMLAHSLSGYRGPTGPPQSDRICRSSACRKSQINPSRERSSWTKLNESYSEFRENIKSKRLDSMEKLISRFGSVYIGGDFAALSLRARHSTFVHFPAGCGVNGTEQA